MQVSLFDASNNLRSGAGTFYFIFWLNQHCHFFKLADADSMGFWAKDVCGSSYFFGNTVVHRIYDLF
jgi:hypothetical protein